MNPSQLFQASPTAGAIQETTVDAPPAVPQVPSTPLSNEPWLLPADWVAFGVGLIFGSTRTIAWGLAAVDVIGRHVSAAYRDNSYMLVHSHLPLVDATPFSGLGRIVRAPTRFSCPPGYSMQPEVKYTTDAYGNVAPGQSTGRMTCQPNRSGTTLIG